MGRGKPFSVEETHEIWLREKNVDDVVYGLRKKSMSEHYLTKAVGQGSRVQDLLWEEKTSLRATSSDNGVKDWSFGREYVGVTCTPLQPLVSRI